MRGAALLLLAGVLAGAPRAAAGQVADTSITPERPPLRPYVAPRVALSVTFGRLGFGDLQAQPVLAEVLDGAGAPTGADTLARTLGAEDGLQVGLSGLVGLTPAWALRAGLTVGRGSLVARHDGEERLERAAGELGSVASTDLAVLAAEAALRFRMRSGRRVQPYAELGMAVVRVEVADTTFRGVGRSGRTSPAAVAAIGAIIPIRGALTGRVQASGQYFRTPAALAPAGAVLAATDTLRLTFMDPEAAPFADAARESLRVLRLEIGFSVELGRMARPTAAPAVRPSAPRR